MTGSERPSPEPLLKKEASPAVLGGREFWKCSGSLKCLELKGLGDPSRTLGIPGNALRAFPGSFRNFSGISSGKSQLYWSGVAPANPTKRSQFMNFSQGHSEQKFNVNRACFPKEKHQNSQKWAKFMNFSFWPFFWFGLPGRLLNWGCGPSSSGRF